jgi:hypothetical protein
MYVVVHSESGEIFGFGLTPEKAMDHFSAVCCPMTDLASTPAVVRRPSTAGLKP